MNASNNPPEPRVRAIFLKAVELTDAAERQRFLDDACAGDAALHAQINALLASHQDDGFLEHPAIQIEPTSESSTEATVSSSAPGPAGTIVLPLASASLASTTIRYFGDYELLEEIARGGMGVVYRARQKSLNRTVAVKMILSGQFATEADVKRFHTEAEAAANLKHPNILAIHEVGEHEGRHYFSMDYIEGKNLAAFIKDNPLPPGRGTQLVKTLAEAVHYAHQRGTLHRDLKPQNVLIDGEGQPHITDFGLAKQMERDSGLTQTGAVMGSPAYMPPEQAAGQNDLVGPPSDVYSLGAVLYHLLTGKAPFAGETAVATMRKVMEEEPTAPSKLNSQTPPDLETICLKCLEKQPERRYATARALAEELGRFLNHEPILAKPASAWRKAWTWSQRHPWAIIGAAAMAGIVLLGFAYGLWERVKYLEGRTPVGSNDALGMEVGFMLFLGMVVYLALLPGVLFARWLKGRKQRNLPVSNLQLALLAGDGLLLVAFGLWSDLWLIRAYVWKSPPFDSLPATVGALLGIPLLLCWAGGILIWQAIRGQQAHWSGSTTAEEEWLPRQPLRYSTLAFLAATFANLALFVSVAYLGIATGLFGRVVNWGDGTSGEAKTLLLIGFVYIALTVSTACWVYATRKVYKRRPLVSIFLGVLFGAVAVGCFTIPPFSVLPPTFGLWAMLAGLVGGWVQAKWVRIRKEGPAEPLTPLVFGELFQWDRRALAIALAIVVIVLGLLAGLFFREDYFFFLPFTALNALGTAFFLAVRATTGKLREFCLSMLVLIIFGVVFTAILGVFPHILATIPIGMAAGCALIYFGKVRPKAR